MIKNFTLQKLYVLDITDGHSGVQKVLPGGANPKILTFFLTKIDSLEGCNTDNKRKLIQKKNSVVNPKGY